MQAWKSWHDEMQSAYLYRIVAQHETLKNRQQLFTRLAQEAEHQAGLWAKEAELKLVQRSIVHTVSKNAKTYPIFLAIFSN